MSKLKKDKAYYAEIAKAMEQYYPCSCGVHICGIAPDEQGFLTIANIPAANGDEARRVWDACRAEAEAAEGDGRDFCVDLNIGPYIEHVDDFWLSRQMLERCLAAGRAALQEAGHD